MTNSSSTSFHWKPLLTFIAFSFIAAAVASAAAFSSLSFGLAPWAMFIGWVAYFTRPISAKQGFYTWLCLACGLVLGAGAVMALNVLSPAIGSSALALVVFVVATTVVSMRAIRVFDNILAWFLGLIAFFAYHAEPSFGAVAELANATALGSAAGWVSQRIQAWSGTKH